MTRKELYEIIKAICPVYWIGQHNGECLNNYVVIKYKNQANSLGNGTAGWQYIDIMLYVPSTSLAGIESTLASVKTLLLASGLEATGNMTPDYFDTDKKAIMRSEEYRLPKQINN